MPSLLPYQQHLLLHPHLHLQLLERASQPRRPDDYVIDEKDPAPASASASPLPAASHISHTSTNHQRQKGFCWRDKMPSFRRCLTLVLIIASCTMIYAAGSPTPKPWRFAANVPPNEASFQDLLDAVSDDALHEVLHGVSDKYKHGAFPEDRAAIKAIHQDSPAMAKSLVELARRQNMTGTTITKVVTPSTSIVVVVPTIATTIVTAVKPTDPVAPTTPAATSPLPQAPNPTTPASTTPRDATLTQTTIPVVTVTSGVIVTSTANAPSPSGMTTSTTTTKVVSTTKEIVFVTTDPNGSPSTVTSYTIVAASEQVTPAVANPSMSVTPSLQNGATGGREPSGLHIAGGLVAALILMVGVL